MEYLLKASAVIALFYLCFYVFLKKETFFQHNRWFLLIGLVIALLFPLIVIPVYITVEPIVVPETLMYFENTTPNLVSLETIFDWTSLLPILYGIGFTVFLIQFIFQFGSLVLLLMKNPKHKDELFTYVIVQNKISPFSFFKWIVYNPHTFEKDELNLILTHEKVHAKQLHSIDILLTQMACVVFWFNPLIWLYRKEVRQNLEFIADYNTQIESTDQKEYQRLLLKTSVANHDISLSNNFYNSLIKERIVMLKKSRSNRKKQWRYLLILPLMAGLLMSMNTETIYVEADNPSTKNENFTSDVNDAQNAHIEIIFNKNLSDKELDDIKKELNANGVTMTIKRIKRNKKDEISDINVDFETENGSANYNVKDEAGIKSFYFKMDENGSFGIGALNENEIIIVEEINTDDLNKRSKSRSKTYIYSKEENKVYSIDPTDAKTLHEEHSAAIDRFKNKASKIYNYKKSDSLIVVSAKQGDNSFFTKDTAYYSIDSTKVKYGFYFEDTKPVEIIKIGESQNIYKLNDKSPQKINYNSIENPKPLIIIDGKEVSNDFLRTINPKDIESMSVLKDDKAIEAYGDKGQHGVIILKMNDTNTWIEKSESKEKSPWSISYSTNYVDTEDVSKNGTLVYITKDSQDFVLKNQKTILEKEGIEVKYSRVKRNKADEIISIKIILKNESGDETSATYKDDDGIPNIEFGIAEGKLKVRTSTMNLNMD